MRTVTPSEVPILDFSDWTSEDPARQAKVVAECKRTLEEFNFVAHRDPRLPMSLIHAAYDQTKKFFALSPEEKLALEDAFRGYMPFGVEQALSARQPDAKEMFHSGWPARSNNPEAARLPDHHPPNRYPEIPGFQDTMDDLWDGFMANFDTWLEIYEAVVGVPRRTWADAAKWGLHTLRLIHYPPVSEEDKALKRERAAEHTGAGLGSMLIPPTHEGLEVYTRQGEWLHLSGFTDSIITVNADQTERLTNNGIPASLHRVANPPDSENVDRYAIVCFAVPRPEVVLDCPPQLVTADHPRIFKNTPTAEQFLVDRMEAVWLNQKPLPDRLVWHVKQGWLRFTGAKPDHKGHRARIW